MVYHTKSSKFLGFSLEPPTDEDFPWEGLDALVALLVALPASRRGEALAAVGEGALQRRAAVGVRLETVFGVDFGPLGSHRRVGDSLVA